MTPPRDPESTRDRLVAAATRLFGENGIEATSTRALTEAAAANIAAVNYHFGSKDGLLRAVIDHSMRSVNAERARRLDELEAAPRPPDVAALVRAFIEPAANLTRAHGDRGRDVARFLGRVLGEANPRTRQIFADQVDAVEGRYLDALGRALPGRDAAEVRFAYTSMLGLLSAYQTGAFADVEFRTGTGHGADRERLIAFVTAGIEGCHIPLGGLLSESDADPDEEHTPWRTVTSPTTTRRSPTSSRVPVGRSPTPTASRSAAPPSGASTCSTSTRWRNSTGC